MFANYEILFSKVALLYYFFILFTEYCTKYGLNESITKDESNVLALADICGVIAFTFLIFFSFKTFWWGGIALLITGSLIYKVSHFLYYNVFNADKAAIKYIPYSKFLLIPLAILLFALT